MRRFQKWNYIHLRAIKYWWKHGEGDGAEYVPFRFCLLPQMLLDQHLRIPGRNKDYMEIFLWHRNYVKQPMSVLLTGYKLVPTNATYRHYILFKCFYYKWKCQFIVCSFHNEISAAKNISLKKHEFFFTKK